MPNVTGRVSAAFVEANGQTRLSDRFHAYPLKIAKAFPFEGGQLGVYVMDASPGIMSGDHYELDWRFGEQTNVFITNQSYTKVHPSRAEAGAAGETMPVLSRQKQTLRLQRGSYVEYMPEPLMLYKDAAFLSSTEVHLEPGSALLMSDVVCPGRTQRGEVFQYDRFQNKLSVFYSGELIYSGRQRIEPARQRLGGIGSWGAYTHSGTLYLFSDLANAALAERLREFIQLEVRDNTAQAHMPMPAERLYTGVSRTYKHGLVLSILGHKVYEIQRLLDAAWQWLRRELFDKPPLLVRK